MGDAMKCPHCGFHLVELPGVAMFCPNGNCHVPGDPAQAAGFRVPLEPLPPSFPPPPPDPRDAEIARLTAENARLRERSQLMEDWYVGAVADVRRLEAENARLREALARCQPLVALLTVRQVIQGGDDAIEASGLNPWCINEGRATGDERIGTWWVDAALNGEPRDPAG